MRRWPDGLDLDAREVRLRAVQSEYLAFDDLVMAAHIRYEVDGAPVR